MVKIHVVTHSLEGAGKDGVARELMMLTGCGPLQGSTLAY